MKAHHRAIASTLLLLAACSRTTEPTEFARQVIGPAGGIITSTDSVLTIAIPPEALDEDVEFFIERSDEPPEVYGQAYLVLPNPELRFDATVTYRQELPADTSMLAVGAIDALDYEEGRGHWDPLPLLRLDRQAKLISGLDSSISVFYGLLDDADPSGSGTTSSGTSSTTGDSQGATTDAPGSTTDEPGSTTDEPGSTTDEPGSTSGGDTGESSGEPAMGFAMDIEPIITANCECHTAGTPGGLDLSNAYASIVDVPSTQVPGLDRIEPGAPEDSYLWHKINDTHLGVGGEQNPMPPPAGGLDAAAIALIEDWILDGANP